MNPKYAKREDENDYEYGLRLIETKIEQRPEDLEWEDIVEATGIDCHRDTLRKAASVTPYSGYAVAQYFKKKYAGIDEGVKDSCITALDCKIAEIQKETKRFQDQRREFNKMVSHISRNENLEARLIEAAENLAKIVPLSVNKTRDTCDGEAEAVIVFADWHYGMVADNIWGKYNTDICQYRVSRLVQNAIERIEMNGIGKLHIVLLGDLAHGAIHVSSRVASEELVCDQIIQVSELVAQAIAELADYVEETYVYATYGNHLRTVQNKKDNLHADNMEKLIPWWLKQRLNDREDIRFPASDLYEFLHFDVCGYNVCAAHGDLDGVKNAGKTLHTLFSKKYNSDLDYIILADKHHREEFEDLGITSMIAPCLCSCDEYANSKRLYSTPAQLMMVFRPGIGADACYQLKLD